MKILSPQEERMEKGLGHELTSDEAKVKRARVNRMLAGFRNKPPRVAVERARLMVESFKETEGLPVVMRWAKALENVMNKIPVYIGSDELIVGRCGPPGRYGLIYPEYRGGWLKQAVTYLPTRKEGGFVLTEEDIRVIKEEIAPYWEGKTLHDVYLALLPEDTRCLMWKDDDPYLNKEAFSSISTLYSINWSLDYEKVLKKGFNGIKREAEERLASLDVTDLNNTFNKAAFLKAVIITCDAMVAFAKRYAKLARSMAEKETSEQRKNELMEIGEICEWVPGNPARTFHEAVQSQWFAQCGSRFEQLTGGAIGNGRIDQYLYPYYKKDIEEGRITDDEVLELLECLWLNIAQSVIMIGSGELNFWEGYTHFEQTSLGGQTADGGDASNELSYLILESKKEFPLDYPDLSVRIHTQTPERFLLKVCEVIREGTGFPKLFNDENVIPRFLAYGATLEEARNWCPNGCTEPRLLNKDTYMTGISQYSSVAALDMALNNGEFRMTGERLGISTGDPRSFTTFDEVMNAFRLQVEFLQWHCIRSQIVAEYVKPQIIAAPLLSCLHDLCIKNCADVHTNVEGSFKIGQASGCFFATVVDSLAAIKKLIYDDKKVTWDELLDALDKNWKGYEVLRQMFLNAPKYGNNDPYVDSIGYEVDSIMLNASRKYRNLSGGPYELVYVPVTAHIQHGRQTAATPNGRKGGEPFSEGVSPSQGCDTKGPTAVLLSLAKTGNYKYKERASRLLNMKLSPQVVAGDDGLKRLASLIRTWCDQKHWHIQFNVINRETLIAAQKDPEKYRNLLVRVAGYSAYFVDLSPELQSEIIARTEQQ